MGTLWILSDVKMVSYFAAGRHAFSGGDWRRRTGESWIVVWQLRHSKRSKWPRSSRDFAACMAMPQIGQWRSGGRSGGRFGMRMR